MCVICRGVITGAVLKGLRDEVYADLVGVTPVSVQRWPQTCNWDAAGLARAKGGKDGREGTPAAWAACRQAGLMKKSWDWRCGGSVCMCVLFGLHHWFEPVIGSLVMCCLDEFNKH